MGTVPYLATSTGVDFFSKMHRYFQFRFGFRLVAAQSLR
jgi:hypothetical protein